MEEKQNYKLTDAEFDEIYKENFGLCALTSKAIEKKYGIKYSRQAVRERADKRFTQQQKDAMIDDLFDVSISTIAGHLQGEECPPSHLRAANSMINFIFKFFAFKRRFPPPKPEQVYKMHGKIHHFGKGY